MSGLILIVTNAGRAALVNAANTGTNAVLMASVGVSATSFTPTPATTALPGEIKRISTMAGEAVANDTIHVTVRDESSAVYTVRSFGLYLSDGTLFAVYSQSDPIMEKSAQAMLLLAIDVAFADIDATQITFGDTSFLNPPATTERPGVVELANDPETIAGSDATRAVTPKGLKAAVTSWLNTRFGDGAPSAFVKGLLTSASAAVLRTSLAIKSAALKDEGPGNGLDADLLDGQHGSYYTDVVARLGYRPWGAGNDGAGSGLDADLLDGLHADQFMRSDTTSATVGFYNPTLAGDLNDVTRLSYRAVIPFNTGYQPGNRPAGNYVSGIEFGAYLDNYRWQFAAAQPAANRFFGRHMHAGTWQDWVEFWHTGNDGAGSGLDADLLDGQHGSYYLPASSYSAADVKAKLLTVDGSGSGVDADMLDGEHGSFYRDASNLNAGTVPVGRLTGTYNIHVSGNAATATKLATARTFSLSGDVTGDTAFDGSGNAAISVTFAAARVLEKLLMVDGSGSGLDADLVDGLHADQFMRSDTTAATVGFLNPTIAGDLNGIARLSYRAVIPFNTGFQPGNRPAGNYLSGIEFGAYLDNYRWQFAAAQPAANRFFGRHMHAGTWQDWVEFWHTGNDGAGSGLDADLLDGQHGSYYLPASSYSAADVKAKLLTVDGSGSGVDADMLDGLHASDFQRVTSQNMAALNGYRVYADGTKECWTSLTIAQHANATWTLPVAHTEFVHPSFAMSTANGVTDVQDNTGISSINGTPPVSITFWNADNRTITIWVRTIGR